MKVIVFTYSFEIGKEFCSQKKKKLLGEEGKLGHGDRLSYDKPKLIEALSGVSVTDIACGSAHSACITSSGNLYTWGKVRNLLN